MSDGRRLVVVSNRVPPVAALGRGKKRRAHAALGGLVTAVRPAVENRDTLWFGWSGEAVEAERLSNTPKEETSRRLTVATLDLTQRESHLYYSGFSNQTLWPLLHSFPHHVNLDQEAFEVYQAVNKRFAEALYPMLRPDDILWVHDFHLFLLGHELRKLGWKQRMGFFLHVPFPPVEIFTLLPWGYEILNGLAAFDLIGVHARRYAANLLDSLNEELDGRLDGEAFVGPERSVRVSMHPIGIDPAAFKTWAEHDEGKEPSRLLQRISPHQQIIVGVDRLDYTKGVPERLLSFETLLDRHKELHEKVAMIQISAPSRSDLPHYIEEKARVEQIVGRVNGRFATADWIPLNYLYRAYAQDELAAIFRRADVCLVTPLRDGMNLVAKEFVASQSERDPGVVILSKFCGAAETMRQALIVNPYDLPATARAISEALNMPLAQRQEHWADLYKDVSTNTSAAWSERFIESLSAG